METSDARALRYRRTRFEICWCPQYTKGLRLPPDESIIMTLQAMHLAYRRILPPGSFLLESRRDVRALFASILAVVLADSAIAAEALRPNIVYILADDLGYGDVHCLNPEHGKIATSCMDRLVSQGMSFSDAHSSSAVCSPSRYGILTGRYNWRSRLQKIVLLPYDEPLIAKGRLTVPKFLSRQGYQTAAIGKWHLGWQWPGGGRRVLFDRPIGEGPNTRGFDYFFGMDCPNFPPYGFIENDRLLVQPTIWLGKQDRTLEIGGFPGPMVAGWQRTRFCRRSPPRQWTTSANRPTARSPSSSISP